MYRRSPGVRWVLVLVLVVLSLASNSLSFALSGVTGINSMNINNNTLIHDMWQHCDSNTRTVNVIDIFKARYYVSGATN